MVALADAAELSMRHMAMFSLFATVKDAEYAAGANSDGLGANRRERRGNLCRISALYAMMHPRKEGRNLGGFRRLVDGHHGRGRRTPRIALFAALRALLSIRSSLLLRRHLVALLWRGAAGFAAAHAPRSLSTIQGISYVAVSQTAFERRRCHALARWNAAAPPRRGKTRCRASHAQQSNICASAWLQSSFFFAPCKRRWDFVAVVRLHLVRIFALRAASRAAACHSPARRRALRTKKPLAAARETCFVNARLSMSRKLRHSGACWLCYLWYRVLWCASRRGGFADIRTPLVSTPLISASLAWACSRLYSDQLGILSPLISTLQYLCRANYVRRVRPAARITSLRASPRCLGYIALLLAMAHFGSPGARARSAFCSPISTATSAAQNTSAAAAAIAARHAAQSARRCHKTQTQRSGNIAGNGEEEAKRKERRTTARAGGAVC